MFLIFCAYMTGFVYAFVVAWTWGNGWLHDMGFHDYSGAAIVHFCGGTAALAANIIIGPRLGKFVYIRKKNDVDIDDDIEK